MAAAAAGSRLGFLPRAALTSCCLMGVGDVVCQTIQQRRSATTVVGKPQQQLKLDLRRTARFMVIGLTLHGPFFGWGFRALDNAFGVQATLRNAIVKSLAGQLTLFPTYTTLFLMYNNALDGGSWDAGVQSIRDKLPTLMATGSLYWPVVNVLNFKLVPPSQRLLAMNCCAIAWNSYLSFVSSSS